MRRRSAVALPARPRAHAAATVAVAAAAAVAAFAVAAAAVAAAALAAAADAPTTVAASRPSDGVRRPVGNDQARQ